jgi:hypothetical protein
MRGLQTARKILEHAPGGVAGSSYFSSVLENLILSGR